MTNCKQKYLNLVQRISFSMAGSKTNSEGQVIILTLWYKLSRDSTFLKKMLKNG